MAAPKIPNKPWKIWIRGSDYKWEILWAYDDHDVAVNGLQIWRADNDPAGKHWEAIVLHERDGAPTGRSTL